MFSNPLGVPCQLLSGLFKLLARSFFFFSFFVPILLLLYNLYNLSSDSFYNFFTVDRLLCI